MPTEYAMIIVASIAALPTIVTIMVNNKANEKTAFEIDAAIMRFLLISIYDKCREKDKRTKFDCSIFYEIYGLYTQKLKQNSYITQEVEPAFRTIPKE